MFERKEKRITWKPFLKRHNTSAITATQPIQKKDETRVFFSRKALETRF